MNGKSRSCDVELFDKKEVISSSKLCSLSFGLYNVSKYCVQSDIDFTLLVFVLHFISFKVFQKSLGLLLRVASNCVEILFIYSVRFFFSKSVIIVSYLNKSFT